MYNLYFGQKSAQTQANHVVQRNIFISKLRRPRPRRDARVSDVKNLIGSGYDAEYVAAALSRVPSVTEVLQNRKISQAASPGVC
jgi:hypothetical protein